MGFFEKLLGRDSEEIPFNQIQGIIENDFGNDITANSVFADIDREDFCIFVETNEMGDSVHCRKDPSKAIDANHWDGLTPEAREALSKQGFYRKGDDNIGIITIEP